MFRSPRHRDEYPPPDEWLIAAPRGRPDRWAHRRGEPRVWALLWSCYLLAACILALFTPASRWSFDTQQVRASCTLLLALIHLGVFVAWPLLRLSQLPPRIPSRAAAIDVLIVALPAVAILAPMGFLTKWSPSLVGALTLSMLGWTALAGAMVALGMRAHGTLARAAWMALCVALVAVGPLIGLIAAGAATGAGATPSPGLWRASMLASPVGAPFALTGFPAPRAPSPDQLAWRTTLAPSIAAAALWLVAIAIDLARPSFPRPGPRGESAGARMGAASR